MRFFFLVLLYICSIVSAEAALKFGLPIDCGTNKSCPLLIQNYVNTGCKEASYEGHKGTDFRLVYFSDVTAGGGVDVLATAPGKVIGVRDGMDDRLPPLDQSYIAGRDCGNGVRIDHGGGWITQTCHMLKGSVSVKNGDIINKGQPLGKVGYSGRAEFPHVHITIEKDDEVMSPFWGAPVGKFLCTDKQDPLWDAAALGEISGNENRVFLGGGAADGAANYNKAKKGDYKDFILKSDSPAFVAWVLTMNRMAGDQDHITILTPEGSVFQDLTSAPLGRHKANFFQFAGKSRKGELFGNYQVVWEGLRGGEVFDTETFVVTVEE